MDRFSLKSLILYRSGQKVVHVGGGPNRNHPQEVNLNIVAMPGVDLVARGERLPFADSSVDVIISNAVLEHVECLDATVSEMNRVLKPGGFAYIEIPFLQHYHTHDGNGVHFEDYRRLTKVGLAQAFSFCTPVDVGVCVGPISGALQIVFTCLTDLSTNSFYRRIVDGLCHLVGNPLSHLDALLSDSTIRRSRVPSGIYFFGRKRDELSSLLERLPASSSAFPRDAKATLTLLERSPDAVRVRIANTSSTVWLRQSPLDWGQVRVGLQHVRDGSVDRDFSRLPLPHDVYPGQSFDATIDLSPFAGATELRIDVVIDGICWLADRGSRPLNIPLSRS